MISPPADPHAFSKRSRVLTWVSLSLCIITIAMWVRSDSHWDTFLSGSAGGTYRYIDSHQGAIWFATKGDCPIDQRAMWSSTSTMRTNLSFNVPKTIVRPDGTTWTRFFMYRTGGEFSAWSSDEPSVYFPSQLDLQIVVPYWPFVPLFAIAPAVGLFFVLRQRRRFKLGLCPKCGAEVHANVERCPECGIPRQLKEDVAPGGAEVR